MKILSALLLFFCVVSTSGQKLVIGSKVSTLKGVEGAEWTPVEPNSQKEFWLIDFVSTQNPSSMEYYENHLPKIADKIGAEAEIVVVGSANDSGFEALRERDKDKYYFLYDTLGKFSALFGLRYLPYSVIVDTKWRIVWQGNMSSLDDSALIEIF